MMAKKSLQKKVISKESKRGKEPRHKKQPFNVSEFRQFNYTSEFIGAAKARPFIDSPVFHTFRLAKDASVPVIPMEKAYPLGKMPINIKRKMDDLKKIEKYLPPEEDIKEFYQEIYMWLTSQNDDEEEVVD